MNSFSVKQFRTFLLSLILFVCFNTSTWAYTFTSGTWKGESIEYIEGDVFIKKASTASEADAADLLKKYDISIEGDFFLTDWAFAKSKDPNVNTLKLMEALQSEPEIDIAEPNLKYEAYYNPDDSYYVDGTQWHLNNYGQNSGTEGADIGIVNGWGFTRGAENYYNTTPIKIGIADTGIPVNTSGTLTHPDLNDGSKIHVLSSHVVDTMNDLHGHGTHVAGIIAANSDNSIGVAGIAPDAHLYITKVLNNTGYGTQQSVIDGVLELLGQGVDIINLSLGGTTRTVLWDAIMSASENAVIFSMAAGNDNTNIGWPARYAYYYFNCIAVGATNRNNVRASWSSYGPAMIVCAPGVSIKSTYSNNGYYSMSGTSMAAPMVTGVAALVKSIDHSLTPRQVRTTLINTATDLGAPGYDQYYGHGMINATAAIQTVFEPILGRLPDGHTTWDYSVVVCNDLTVGSSDVLEINPGVHVVSWNANYAAQVKPHIHVYGKLDAVGTADDPIVFRKDEERILGSPLGGPSLRFYSQCDPNSIVNHCKFIGNEGLSTGAYAIFLIGEQSDYLYLNNPIEYNTFENCTAIGINARYSDVDIKNNIFNSPAKAIDYYMPYNGVKIESNDVYNGSNIAISVNGSRVVFRHNFLDFSETTNRPIGIQFVNSSGSFCWHNTIQYASNGFKLIDSDITMSANLVECCESAGLYIHNSIPDMSVSGAACNFFSNNYYGSPRTQIYIDGNVYPYMANGYNNIFPGSADAIETASAPTATTDLSNNYWGPAYPNPPAIFNPYCTYIDITPYSTGINQPFSGYLTSSLSDNQFENALEYYNEQRYEEAADIFEEILQNSTDTYIKYGSINRLVDCWKASGTLRETSISLLEDYRDQATDQELINKIENRIAYINVQLGHYADAIHHYESVMMGTSHSAFDKLYAEMDAKTAYMIASETIHTGDKGTALNVSTMGTISDLCPTSILDYEEDIANLTAEVEKLIRETDQEEISEEILPTKYAITSAYPNPFNPSITIAYSLPERSDVSMKVYDVLGKEVTTLMKGTKNAGNHTITWNATEKGLNVASGVYFIHFQTPESNITKKVVLMK